MKKIIHKCFFIWNFDKEEKWLNEMAAKGFILNSVGFCRYEFDECIPGEYKICMELLENKFKDIENINYINFIEETGAEHISTYVRWAYFRKKTEGEDFRLFSDNASIVKHMTRIIHFTALICGLNLYTGCYNLFLYFYGGSWINLGGCINLLLGILIGIGLLWFIGKRKKIKAESQIFE